MPDGYNTRISEGGAKLSAGQRQRIGLARALFGEPSLVVLDEPNSNLDSDGDLALTKALAELRRRRRTVVIVTHRPVDLQAVDKILILRNGTVTRFADRDEVLRAAEDLLLAQSHVQRGDLIVLTIGEPMGKSGGTNTMKIVRVGDHRS